jgi:hypothetical protein
MISKLKAFVFKNIGARARQKIWLKKVGVQYYTVRFSFDKQVTFAGNPENPLWTLRSSKVDGQEPGVVRWISDNAGVMSCFVDIGANLGFFSVLAADCMPSGKIYSFEPSEYLRGWLNISMAEKKNVQWTAVGKFVGAKSTKQMVSLDDYFALQNAIPDLVKIDVDGAETDILKGGQGLLKNGKTCWLIEVHPGDLPKFGSSVEDFFAQIPEEHCTIKFLFDLRKDNLIWSDGYVPVNEDFFIAIVPKERMNNIVWYEAGDTQNN